MTLVSTHATDCRFFLAANCAVEIECDHGRSVCPICDPCTCSRGMQVEDTGPYHMMTLEKNRRYAVMAHEPLLLDDGEHDGFVQTAVRRGLMIGERIT